jgi:hypothetical protein
MNFKEWLIMEMDLETDPDELFEKGTGHTFIWSASGKLHWDSDSVTHYSLLADPKVFADVYGPKANQVPMKDRKVMAGMARQKGLPVPKELSSVYDQWNYFYGTEGAMEEADAICGRTGRKMGYYVISTWNGIPSPNSSYFQDYIRMLRTIVGTFVPKWNPDKIVITSSGGQIADYSKLVGGQAPIEPDNTKMYLIGGQNYNLEQLTTFKKWLHVKPSSDPERQKAQVILCHPDIHKYPELHRLTPNCSPIRPPPKGRRAWSLALRQSNLPDYLNQESALQ